MDIKVFDFVAPDKTRRFGTARVLNSILKGSRGEDGFATDNGGYALTVIESNYYSPGEIITVSRGAVRHFITDLVTGTR